MPYKVFDHTDLLEMSSVQGTTYEKVADTMGQLEQTGYILHSVVPDKGQGYNSTQYIFRRPETGAEAFDRYAERFK